MNKFDKIAAALEGKEAGEMPFSFWSHFPEADMDPRSLADATSAFYETYDVDFVKTCPNGMFSIEDFGCECDYSAIEEGGVAKVISYPIKTIADWEQVRHIDCLEGALGRELQSLQMLLKKIGNKVPVIATAFSPLTTAAKMSNNLVFKHMQEKDCSLLHRGLSIIADVTGTYIRKAISLGASGVFFASQTGSLDVINKKNFSLFGERYDLAALDGAAEGWFNTVHIHGNNISFKSFLDYPVQVLNWHIGETAPSIHEARKISDKCFMGGINRTDITNLNRTAILEQIRTAVRESNGKKQILSPGCVIRYPLETETLKFVSAAARSGGDGSRLMEINEGA